MCGVVEWETIGERAEGSPAEVDANSKYIVFIFRTSTFTGELKSSAEGRMEWMTLDEMRRGGLAYIYKSEEMLSDGVSLFHRGMCPNAFASNQCRRHPVQTTPHGKVFRLHRDISPPT